MKRGLIAFAAMLAVFAFQADATGQTYTYQLQVFEPGANPVATPAPMPFFTFEIPADVIVCNTTQTMPSAGLTPVTNPTVLWWAHEDPLFPTGTVCKADLSAATAWLTIAPGGPYPTTITVSNAAGSSPPRVLAYPFLRTDTPLVIKQGWLAK
jgi:hypothetical protein